MTAPGPRVAGLRLSWLVAVDDGALATAVDGLRRYLDRAGLTDVGPTSASGADDAATAASEGAAPASTAAPAGTAAPADAVVVVADRPLADQDVAALLESRVPLVLLGPTLHSAADQWRLSSGLVSAGATATHDVRVRPGPAAGALAARLGDHGEGAGAHLGEHVHVHDRVLLVDKLEDDVEVLLTAHVGLDPQPVAVRRGRVLGWSLGSTPEALASPGLRRLVAVATRLHARPRLADAPLPPEGPGSVRVGLLGYGAIGHEHSRAVAAVAGLELAAVCDRSAQRLAAARAVAPDVHGSTDPDALIADPDVDLVVVSTPPDSHAHWALRAIEAGKHVVVEKPFALDPAEADDVLAAAAAADRLAVVYQNRRWDPDYLALRRAVRAGRVGEVFSVETFVGGYGHPCNLWHSDAAVSGGVFYDWGAHVLDQVLDLVPARVEQVTAASHKRVWHDVTNADHARVTLRFAGGAEADFVYSDIAAALKPRWYVLGTAGAVVGHWRVERVVRRNDVGTLAEDTLAPADSPPVLDLHEPDGSVTRLATPPSPVHAFHRELADHLLLGLPMSVTGESSRRVLSVMAAAAESAATGSRPVVPR